MKQEHLVMISKSYCIFTDDVQLFHFGYEKNEHYKIMLQGSAIVIYRVKIDQTVGLIHRSF